MRQCSREAVENEDESSFARALKFSRRRRSTLTRTALFASESEMLEGGGLLSLTARLMRLRTAHNFFTADDGDKEDDEDADDEDADDGSDDTANGTGEHIEEPIRGAAPTSETSVAASGPEGAPDSG